MAGILDWLRNRARRIRRRAELDRLSEPELSRIASDVGISDADLRELTGKDQDSAALLLRRLAALGLETSEVRRQWPAVLRDLQRLCSVCESKGRCQWDIDRDPDDPRWREYCPNVLTLDNLRDEIGRR